MTTLKKGCKGEDVIYLQKLLCELGYFVTIDGDFGNKTDEVVRRFQKDANLKDDGIVGNGTWAALESRRTAINDFTLDFEKAANTLNVEVAAIRAVHQVESGGRSGFLPDGRPEILFEGHCFWGQLKLMGMNPESFRAGNEDILYPSWDQSFYKGKTGEYVRLNRASVINHEAALMSASWGMFQIMGFNHKLCGYDSVYKFCASMYLDSDHQLQAFVSFLLNTKLDVPLRELKWAEFARRYNGARYEENRYDKKLEEAYNQFK